MKKRESRQLTTQEGPTYSSKWSSPLGPMAGPSREVLSREEGLQEGMQEG